MNSGASRTRPRRWRYSTTPAEIRYPPPLLGQHTDETLAGLGYAADEIANLHAEGAV